MKNLVRPAQIIFALITVLVFFESQGSSQLQCKELFSFVPQIHRPVELSRFQNQARKFNPEIVWSDDLQQLYLQLKNEEWKVAPVSPFKPMSLEVLDDKIRSHLKTNFGKSHDLEFLDGISFSRFYVNGIRGLYFKVAEKIYLDSSGFSEKERQKGLDNIQKSLVIEVVIKMSGKDLRDRSLSPDQATQVFERLLNIDKTVIQKIVNTFQQWRSEEGSELRLTSWTFQKWLERTPDQLRLDKNEIQIASGAINRIGLEKICCVASLGCHSCPLNRRSLRRDRF